MTMARLMSRRMADEARKLSRPSSNRLSTRVSAGNEAAMALEEWESEGGSADLTQAKERLESRPSPVNRLLLERLGAALVGEWNNLSAPLQRAVFERATAGGASLNRLTTRRLMARFLHDQKKPGAPPATWA
jgi:hypothetical protein